MQKNEENELTITPYQATPEVVPASKLPGSASLEVAGGMEFYLTDNVY